MNKLVSDHLIRVKTAVQGTYGLTTLDRYIEEKTYLGGKKFSFEGHEFQRDVLKDGSPTVIVVKIAQVGLSELAYRLALAACRVIDDFTVIYTFPNAGDALTFSKTRIDPIIAGSPDLKQAVNPSLDNSEVKQFGRSSFLYMRGTRSQAGAISVPADMVIHDEWDKSDVTTASMFIARLQHKPTKIRKLFSTPTVNKFGILKEAETARRHRHMQKCMKCNHRWLPDYFSDIVIPGYSGDIKEITKHNIKNYRWKEAKLVCPKCGRDPEASATSLEWVVENPNDAFEASAYFISAFSAPKIITPSYLVNVSTQYERYSEFMNQSLGLAAEEEDDTLTETDVRKAIVQADLNSSNLHCFAADMGQICHITIGREAEDGTVLVVHRERCPLSKFEERRGELIRQYRCQINVQDSQPYTDMVRRITESDLNAYGAIFVTFKSGPTYRVQEQEEDAEEGKLNFRMVKIKRNEALDTILALFKRGEIVIASQGQDEDEEYVQQLQSLKRVRKFDTNQELSFVWEKTGDENDHYHFSLLYLHAAITLRGMSVGTISFLQAMPVMRTIRTKGI